MGKLDALKDKVKQKAISAVAAKLLHNAAEGKYGPRVQKLYWNTAGLKTVIGGALVAMAGALMAAQDYGLCDLATQHWAWVNCELWLDKLAWAEAGVGSFFIWLGTVDAGLRLDPPAPSRKEKR